MIRENLRSSSELFDPLTVCLVFDLLFRVVDGVVRWGIDMCEICSFLWSIIPKIQHSSSNTKLFTRTFTYACDVWINYSDGRFDFLEDQKIFHRIREHSFQDRPSTDMPTWIQRWNRQYRQAFLVDELISQFPLSIHLYRLGARSLILRRKKPSRESKRSSL